MKNNSRDDNASMHDPTTTISIVVVVVVVVLCLITPVLINIAFQHIAPVGVLEARWTPGELLGYAGGVFSCLGTVFLGCLTLHQNRLLRDETNRRIKAEEERNRLAFRPAFNIVFRDGTGDRIRFELQNVSSSFVRDIVISKIVGIDDKGQAKWSSETQRISFLDRGGAERFQVGELNSSKLSTSNKLARIEMYLSCINQFGEEYLYELVGFRVDKGGGDSYQFRWKFEEVDAAEIEKRQAVQTSQSS